MKTKVNLIDILASLISIGAGVYLLLQQSASVSVAGVDSGTSWFEIIAHGMGAYFIAKGLWMARSLYLQAEQRDRAAQLVSLDAAARTDEGHGADGD